MTRRARAEMIITVAREAGISRTVHTVFRLGVMTPSWPSGALQRKLCTGKYDVNRRIVDPELAFAGEWRWPAVWSLAFPRCDMA